MDVRTYSREETVGKARAEVTGLPVDYPLFAVDEITNQPYLPLGKPNPAVPFTAGPCGVYGRYTCDGKITWNGLCQNPWEFMATGTGVSGIAVAAGREIYGQINHSATFCEQDEMHHLGRFKLQWHSGDTLWPEVVFSGLDKTVRMEHDLRKSLIAITSEGGGVNICAEVRAHRELDLFRIDITENIDPFTGRISGLRRNPGEKLHLNLSKDYAHHDCFENNIHLSWHVNASGTTKGRCYGTAIAFDLPENCTQRWFSGRCEITKKVTVPIAKYTLWIVPGSHAKGYDAWREDVTSRLAKARALGDKFNKSHETWWHKFWERSRIEFPGDNGTHLRHQAAFELYRYFTACSADARRETPLRFFSDLLRNIEDPAWTRVDITAFEQYQDWLAAVRAGDMDLLQSRLNALGMQLPAWKRWVKKSYGHDGAVFSHFSVTVSPSLGSGEITNALEADGNIQPFQSNSNGTLYILLLMCDYAGVSGDTQFVDEVLLPWAVEAITFFQTQYPEKDANGHIDFTPSQAGESYYHLTNSAELIVALKSLLPRLRVLGASRGLDQGIMDAWLSMENALPELPRGKIVFHEGRTVTLEKGDILAPMAKFLNPTNRMNNRQLLELYAVWPGKLLLRSPNDRELAIRTYNNRVYKNSPEGWPLDVVVASCLGLKDEVKKWWPYTFDTTFTFPDGMAQESAPCFPEKIACTFSHSLQGSGTAAVAVCEMLMQDYPDLLIILPCWEADVAVRYTLYSPYAGKVTVDYDPGKGAAVQTERPIKIAFGEGIMAAQSPN